MKKTNFFIIAAVFIICFSITFSGCLFRKADRFRLEESLVNGVSAFPTGEEDDGECETVDYSYYVAKYQTTFTLWEEVYNWATDEAHGDNQYYFQNEGNMGGGSDSVIKTGKHPVTNINAHDAMVWCNALTEYYNYRN